ncbi:hypothetical protein ACFPT7_15505 [Acidicapsa dinghuensis]|uniref:Uncharacterized protein n=1 Tax=Acidicapsa dinghuensis TaxID=2218256 RepID=A0ABW1EL67_9BACT|nr:hypothetical protein [Acidicapsa dinghuensis]
MQNYFNYFTEIEEHFQRRRGSLLLLSTLDWALIETWRESGIPLEAVLRGIDNAFDKYDARQQKARMRRVNGLAWCAQAVLEAAGEMVDAATGVAPEKRPTDAGFEHQRIAQHLNASAHTLKNAAVAPEITQSISAKLDALSHEISTKATVSLEDLERELAMLEDKLFATLTTHAPEDLLLRFKTEAARDLAAYRSRMSAVQLRQVEQQFVHKRLLEHYSLPRLSLFYMSQAS